MQKPPKSTPVAFRIELREVKPLIWRRIVVSNQSTLATFHKYLQWVMGWEDSHAHEFQIGDRIVGPEWWLREIELGGTELAIADERRVSVAAVVNALGVGGCFGYRYDMGDGWNHSVTIEEVPPTLAHDEFEMPICTAGENACPPEDVGGPPGYQYFLECIGNTNDPDRTKMLRWVGGVFDARGFDLNRINREWRGRRKRQH